MLAPKEQGQWARAARPKEGGSWEDECRATGIPHLRKPSPPTGNHPPHPRRAMSEDEFEPRGRCRAPMPARRTHTQWATDPNCPPAGRAAGGGCVPELRHPSRRHEAPPTRTPSCHARIEQRQLTRACAVRSVTGPNSHTAHTHKTMPAGAGYTPKGQAVGGG